MPKIVSTAKHATSSVHPRISIGNVQRAVADQPMVACKMSLLFICPWAPTWMYYGRPQATPHFQSGTNPDSSSVSSFYVLIIVYSILYRVKSAHSWPKKSSVGPKYVHREFQVPRRLFEVRPDSKKYKINFVSFWHACDFTLQIDQCGLSKVLLCK